MKYTGAQWQEPSPVIIPDGILDLVDGDHLTASALVRRGIHSVEIARGYLNPNDYSPASPSDLPDFDQAIDRIIQAIQKRERIGIWGDFDVDGQTATAVLVGCLRSLGCDVAYRVPIRAVESHGIQLPHLQSFLKQGISLLITCDTGITAHESIDYAQKNGVDVILTDHHTLPEQLPPAFAVINSQRLPEHHPSRTLSGVGAAYLVCREVASRMGNLPAVEDLLDLVALGMVADLAALKMDARYLVQLGLRQCNRSLRPAFQAIFDRAEISPVEITEEQFGFILAPRLNAVGRLGDANPLIEFLLTPHKTLAEVTAARLEGMNAQRKLLTDQVFGAAQSQVEQHPDLLQNPILILSHPQWSAGVLGIVASRLVELYQRPVILLQSPAGQPARGSARSIEGVHITAALSEAQSLLLGFGGHPMAAGLSLPEENLPAFQRTMIKIVERMKQEQNLTLELNLDAQIPWADLALPLAESFKRLAPFGPGNPAPILYSKNLSVASYTRLGKTGEHLLVVVEDENGLAHRVIYWQGGGMPMPEGQFDLAYTIRTSSYRGEPELQIEWVATRTIETDTIIVTPPSTMEVEDYRHLDAFAWLKGDPAIDQSAIWQEGTGGSPKIGTNRMEIGPSSTLVILTPPAGPEELASVVASVHPLRVILLYSQVALDHPELFLQTLSGLVQFTLRQKKGKTFLLALAAATAQREISILRGLQWLEASGYIRFNLLNFGEIEIFPGGVPSTRVIADLERQVRLLLAETNAYREYYRRAPVHQLLG